MIHWKKNKNQFKGNKWFSTILGIREKMINEILKLNKKHNLLSGEFKTKRFLKTKMTDSLLLQLNDLKKLEKRIKNKKL